MLDCMAIKESSQPKSIVTLACLFHYTETLPQERAQ